MVTSKQRVFFSALGFGWLQYSEPLPSAAILTLYLSLMLVGVSKSFLGDVRRFVFGKDIKKKLLI